MTTQRSPGHRVVRRLRRRHRCPRCGGSAVARTGRQGPLERIYLSLASQRPYVCRECNHRFYDRPL